MPQKARIMPISKLEKQAGSLQIPVYLYEHKDRGKIRISELMANVKATSETVTKAIVYLKTMGLVEDEYTRTFPQQHLVWLTDKGEEVARMLSDVSKKLP